jgi:hypothetical protein
MRLGRTSVVRWGYFRKGKQKGLHHSLVSVTTEFSQFIGEFWVTNME